MATKKTTKTDVEITLVSLKVVREFIDKTNGEYRKTHTVFEASAERAEELIALGYCVAE